jgi:mevalonate kinase
VGMALPETLTVRLTDVPGLAWDLDVLPPADRAPILAVLASLEQTVPGLAACPRCRIEIDSTIPRGSGFGSSAALCGALALAALEHAGAATAPSPPDPLEAWRHAHAAERHFHGTPSGVDTGLALLGGVLGLQPRPPTLPAVERLPGAGLTLVTGAVPRDAACGELIAGIGARMRAGHAPTRAALERLGGLAAAARDVLEAAPPRAAGADGTSADAFGRLAAEAMTVLRDLGLSTRPLETVLDAGMRAGAAGGKLSGGGGGGAFYLVAPDAAQAPVIAGAVNEAARRAGIPLAAPARVLPA